MFTLLMIPGMAQAVICKSVDAEGVVSYSDVPAAECRKRVKLPPNSTYQPRQLPRTITPKNEPAPRTVPEVFSGYTKIGITQPEANGTVRSNEGNVAVVIELQPPLQNGHRIKLFLDGGAVSGDFDGTAIDLQGVNRGTHSLRAVVSDEKGRRLADSPSVRFTLRKVGLFDKARMKDKDPDKPKPENPIAPVPEQPIAPVPENPIAGPGDGQGSLPAVTPGQTNPAYKPNYSPN